MKVRWSLGVAFLIPVLWMGKFDLDDPGSWVDDGNSAERG